MWGIAPEALHGLHAGDVKRIEGIGCLASLETLGLTGVVPAWLVISDNPLGDDAQAAIQALCDRGWAVTSDILSCGNTCLFEDCTL